MRVGLHALTVFLELWTTIFVGGITGPDLNHVILPRSSLFHLAQRRHRPKVDVWTLLHLLRPLEGFVKALYDGQGSFNSFPYSGLLINHRVFERSSILDSRANNFSNVRLITSTVGLC
jgi:hypothetical protein